MRGKILNLLPDVCLLLSYKINPIPTCVLLQVAQLDYLVLWSSLISPRNLRVGGLGSVVVEKTMIVFVSRHTMLSFLSSWSMGVLMSI